MSEQCCICLHETHAVWVAYRLDSTKRQRESFIAVHTNQTYTHKASSSCKDSCKYKNQQEFCQNRQYFAFIAYFIVIQVHAAINIIIKPIQQQSPPIFHQSQSIMYRVCTTKRVNEQVLSLLWVVIIVSCNTVLIFLTVKITLSRMYVTPKLAQSFNFR